MDLMHIGKIDVDLKAWVRRSIVDNEETGKYSASSTSGRVSEHKSNVNEECEKTVSFT